MTKTLTALTLTTALAALAAPALAQSKGDFTLGFGLGLVAPDDSFSTTAAGQLRPNDDIRPTLTFEYFIADNLGIEVLAAAPFEHNVELQGAGDVVSLKHLPPTISLQYHIPTGGNVKPFVGAGINYTTFWDEKGIGALAGTPVSLDDSWGIALHAGVDFKISDRGAMRADVRWINIETDATVGGNPIGKVKIDPVVLGVSYILSF
ncbi:OmpW/AlkL family protein [Roseovarius sp. 2305UL8-3]|uniref:OmpW/AlkL family protein n=1 Tax=Roseovarius conchicola TaxID=3121636 RepID=UPI0035295DD0